VISSAQALTAPRTTHRSRALVYAPPRRYVLPAPVSVNPKLAIAAGAISLIALVVVILTHMGTYDVALTRFPAQSDVQATATAKTQSTKTASQPAINASKDLVRIDQTSIGQYSSQEEHDTWSPSTCSTASLTEVINSYGHSYKVTDILKIEAGIGAITADQGLLYPEGIDQTAAKFSFNTQTLNNPTLDQVLAIANGGKPVIVNFPPETWAGGHFLVVVGGSTIDGTAYVHLADSSTLNMQYMKRDRFLYYWKGLAKVLTPKVMSTTTTASNNQYTVAGKPTLTASFMNQVLAAYNSPAQGKGQALYDLGVQNGINPAFALAFFLHESTLGTKGEASMTLSLGNLRCIQNTACVNTAGQTCQQGESCYAAFPTWEAGFKAWYSLILNGYIQGGINQTIGKNACPCVTIAQIIPVYAPASDNNDEQAYIDSLKHSLDVWHSGQLKP
jgi:hypothetical protein